MGFRTGAARGGGVLGWEGGGNGRGGGGLVVNAKKSQSVSRSELLPCGREQRRPALLPLAHRGSRSRSTKLSGPDGGRDPGGSGERSDWLVTPPTARSQ